jgi:ABC-type lipoprotein release transport system permease subunit
VRARFAFTLALAVTLSYAGGAPHARSTNLPAPPRTSQNLPEPPPTDIREVLLSRQLLTEANLKVGDLVTLAADEAGTRATEFRIAGAYEPTPDPARFNIKRFEARLHLSDLSAVADEPSDREGAESVSAFNLRLTSPDDTAAMISTLTSRTPGIVARSTARTRGSDPFAVLERFHLAIAIVTVLGSSAFLLALMVMRAEERSETIGIQRLIGVSDRSILLGVLLEGLLIAAAGAIFGVLVAVAAQGTVNRFFQWRYDTTLVFVQVTASIAMRAIALSVPLGVLAGLVGSWSLLRRRVLSLIRR